MFWNLIVFDASQKAFLYTLFTIDTARKGNKLFSSLFVIQKKKKAPGFLRGFRKELYNHKTERVLILPLKPNKKHDIGPPLPRVRNGSGDGNMARDLEDWAFIPHTLLTNHSMEWVLRTPGQLAQEQHSGAPTAPTCLPLVPLTSCVPGYLMGLRHRTVQAVAQPLSPRPVMSSGRRKT